MLNPIDALNTATNGAAAIFVGLAPSLPPLFTLIKFFCILLGAGLIVHSVMRLRRVNNRQNQAEIGPVIFQMFAGVILINLNLFIATGAETLFGGENHKLSPLAYSVTTGGDWVSMRSKNIALAILSFIQFVGYISVARGITELNNHAHSKPNASLGKGLTHVVGGILATNITLTTSMLASTFGLKDFF